MSLRSHSCRLATRVKYCSISAKFKTTLKRLRSSTGQTLRLSRSSSTGETRSSSDLMGKWTSSAATMSFIQAAILTLTKWDGSQQHPKPFSKGGKNLLQSLLMSSLTSTIYFLSQTRGKSTCSALTEWPYRRQRSSLSKQGSSLTAIDYRSSPIS